MNCLGSNFLFIINNKDELFVVVREANAAKRQRRQPDDDACAYAGDGRDKRSAGVAAACFCTANRATVRATASTAAGTMM